MHDKHGKFQTAGHANLVENFVDMVFDCLLGQRELQCNVPIGQSINNSLRDLKLAGRETKTFFGCKRGILQNLDQPDNAFLANPELASNHSANTLQKKLGRRVLTQNAPCAQLESLNDFTLPELVDHQYRTCAAFGPIELG